MPRSDQPDFLELCFDDLLVERLHDVLVCTRVQRARDVRDIIFRGAEHDLGAVAVRHPAQHAQELIAVHLRHVPVEQHCIRHPRPAGFNRLLAVLGLGDLELEPFENSPRHLANDARIVNDQTSLHLAASFYYCGLPRGYFPLTVSILRPCPYAASEYAPTSRTRSRSSTTMRLPSR